MYLWVCSGMTEHRVVRIEVEFIWLALNQPCKHTDMQKSPRRGMFIK